MRLDELGRKKDWTFREKALRRELVTSDNSSSDIIVRLIIIRLCINAGEQTDHDHPSRRTTHQVRLIRRTSQIVRIDG